MVAKAMNKSPSMVSKVVASKVRSYSVAEGVAKVLGKTIDDVFPGQYLGANRKKYRTTDEYETKIEELRTLLQEKSVSQ
jgi:transcriptional regulator with XRE-family HTH domain